MKYFLICILLIFISYIGYSQEKPSFNVQIYAGLLEGSSGSAFQLQALPGVAFRSWIAGLGTGLDYYYRRSVPLFLSLRRDLSIRNSAFFINADGGLNYEWTKKTNLSEGDFKPAPYYSANLGYRWPIANKTKSVLLSVGYSFKQLKESRSIINPCQVPPCPQRFEVYRYDLNRWSFRTGFQFH